MTRRFSSLLATAALASSVAASQAMPARTLDILSPVVGHVGEIVHIQRVYIPAGSPLRGTTPIVVVSTQEIRRRVEFPAVVQAIPARTVEIRSPIVGRIGEVAVQMGDRVSLGQEISTIVPAAHIDDPATLHSQHWSDIQEVVQRLSLRSPIAGSVIQLRTRPGDSVEETSIVASIADLRTVGLTWRLSRRSAALLGPERTAEITFTAYPDVVVTAQAQFDSGSDENDDAIARIELTNPDFRLKVNMSAIVTLFGPRRSVATIPTKSLIQKDGLTFALREIAPWTFELRLLKISFQEGDQVTIEQGLSPGDHVVAVPSAVLDGQ
jgi:membrane fusion protein, heavy metal efflux system